MVFNLPSFSPALGYALTTMFLRIRDVGAESAIRAIAEAIKPGIINSSYHPKSGAYGYEMYIRWQDLMIVLIDGVTGLQQATHYTNALDVETNYNRFSGANEGLLSRSLTSYDRLWAIGDPRIVPTIVAGHSMGGAVAIALTYRLQALVANSMMRTITFGAPRSGVAEFANTLRSAFIQRWNTVGDPVPNVPPRQSQAPLLYAFFSRAGRSNSNRFEHASGGTTIADDGTLTAEDVPTGITEVPEINLGTWLLQIALQTQNAHSMSFYSSYLLRRKDSEAANEQAGNHTTTAESHVPPSPRSQEQMVIQAISDFTLSIKDRDIAGERIPEDLAFRAKKVGAVWVCQLRGETISLGPTRRRARSMAAKGNRFLEKLQIQGQVDPSSLIASMSLYLDDAADPLSAFRPTMNT